MSDNQNVIYVFVKGNKGRGAYYISNHDQHVELHSDVLEDLIEDGKELNSTQSDFETIIHSLKYIGENQGKNNTPKKPAIFIYTSFESVYGGANPNKERGSPEERKYETKGRFDRFSALRSKLLRENKIRKAEVYFVPDTFINEIKKASSLLNDKPKPGSRP
ncbi:MAG: hypothetical protein ACHQJ6_07300 [Candidatus Berkiellales bacterium]